MKIRGQGFGWIPDQEGIIRFILRKFLRCNCEEVSERSLVMRTAVGLITTNQAVTVVEVGQTGISVK